MNAKEKTVKQKLLEKLTSRKFWAAVLAALGALVCALVGDTLGGEELDALRCGVTALVAYIFGEGAVDLARVIRESGKKE